MEKTKGRYFDGLSIKSQRVTLELQDDFLRLQSEDEVIEWHIKDILLIESPHHHQKNCVLGCTLQKGARVLFENDPLFQVLKQKIDKKNIHISHVSHPWRNLIIASIGVFILFGFVLWGVPYFAAPISKIVPHQWDDSLGKFVISQITSGYKQCTDSKGSEALQKIVDKLSANQNLEHPLKVKVVDMEDINAFAVPGFQIIILKGLIDSSKTPDEVAGVLAHEMAHAVQHHPTSGLITQLGIKILINSATGTFTDVSESLINLTYSRKNEFEADRLGVGYLNDAQISAQGLVQFFESISHMSDDLPEITVYISTHPAIQHRVERVKQLDLIKKAPPVLTQEDWKSLQNICREKQALKF